MTDIKFVIIYGILLQFVSITASAASVKVYRWIDSRGVVNFSQYRPDVKDYDEIEVEGERLLSGVKSKTRLDIETRSSDLDSDLVDELDQEAAKYCKKAKHNLKVLESHSKVRVKDEEGNAVVLKESEVLEQKRLALRQVEMFCK